MASTKTNQPLPRAEADLIGFLLEPTVGSEPTTYGLQILFAWFGRVHGYPQVPLNSVLAHLVGSIEF